MKLSQQVKPISELKANAPKVIQELARSQEPVVITVHGEAKAVLQDIASYEATQETMALLKMLALSSKSIQDGKVQPASEALDELRRRRKSQAKS
jgi:prevent-host-death family protein